MAALDPQPCVFYRPQRELISQNRHAIAVFDTFPVSPGHALVLPRRHAVTIRELAENEYQHCFGPLLLWCAK